MRRAVSLTRFGGAALLVCMPTFSYQYGSNPPVDYPRLLISDTQQFAADGVTPIFVFYDEEIAAMTAIQTLQWQTSMFYSEASGQNLPASPVNYLRIAAMLLDSIAANKSRLASIQMLLDVKLSPDKAAAALRDQANQYRTVDDESGAFAIIEQCNDYWSFRDRFWKQVQRQSGGGAIS